MTSKVFEYVVRAGMLALVLSVSFFVPSSGAQQSAMDALQKARVVDRLAEGMAVERKGASPGFVLDPAWPQPLPNREGKPALAIPECDDGCFRIVAQDLVGEVISATE